MREEENCYQSRQLSSCHRRSPEGERRVKGVGGRVKTIYVEGESRKTRMKLNQKYKYQYKNILLVLIYNSSPRD